MTSYADIGAAIQQEHGLEATVAALGYPGAWAHTRQEITKLRDALKRKVQQ